MSFEGAERRVTLSNGHQPDAVSQRAFLIVAHPGHEALLHAWMEEVRPTLMILTDGSGSGGASRIEATRDYIRSIGIDAGPVFGQFSDRFFYEKIVAQDFPFFRKLADEIAHALLSSAELVVGDAAEGYNPVHDICRLVVNCAIARAERASGRLIKNYEYPVVGNLRARSVKAEGFDEIRELDDATFKRKLDAVRKHYPELVNEVLEAFADMPTNPYRRYFTGSNGESAISASGLKVFRSEYLRGVSGLKEYAELVGPYPFYETCGEQKATDGLYSTVIRRDQHILPIADSLQRYASAVKTTHA